MRKNEVNRHKLMGDAGVMLESICDEEGYRKTLNAIGTIGRYSKLDYILMAMIQCPEMTVVRTKKEWEKLGAAPKDEDEGIWFATDIPFSSGVSIWAKYDISQVSFAEMPAAKIRGEGAMLASDAAKAAGSMENAFRAALHAQDNETVYSAIRRLCDEADLPDEWHSSVCYTVWKWFGVRTDGFDFSKVDPDDYAEALTSVCECSAGIVKAMEKEFRQIRKGPAKKPDPKIAALEERIGGLESEVANLKDMVQFLGDKIIALQGGISL